MKPNDVIAIKAHEAAEAGEPPGEISSGGIESPKIVFRSHGFEIAAIIPDKH